MMRCPSIWPTCRWSLFGPQTAEACPTRRNSQIIHMLHRIQRTNEQAKRVRIHPFVQPIHPTRSSTPTVTPIGGALSP